MHIVVAPPHFHISIADDGTVSGSGPGLVPEWVGAIRLDDQRIVRALGITLPPHLADLADVALAVHVADRLCRRRGRDIDRWMRRIAITIPVRDPSRWNNPARAVAVADVLAHLTGDEWDFRFVPRRHALRPAERQLPLLARREPLATVALFSGGLDSLAGLTRELLNLPPGRVALVSLETNHRLGALQRDLVMGLRGCTSREIDHIAVPFGYRHGGRSYDHDEPTQRTRGFAFLILGAVVALTAGRHDLTVNENGIGAINLPLSAAQFGAQMARSVAPETLVQMGAMVRLATGSDFAFRLPHLFETKASLCGSMTALGATHLVGDTVSCDGFPLRIIGACQCGVCTSCLLRRQSLHAAGLADRDPHYLRDVLDPPMDMTPERWHALRLMRGQVREIGRALAQPDAWRSLCVAYPQLVDAAAAARTLGLAGDDVGDRLVALFRRYRDEWAAFPAVPVRQATQVAA